MSTDDTVNKPGTPPHTTPMRTLSSLFRTPTTVSRRNKRARARGRSSSSPSKPSTPSTPSLPGVVLQTYSLSTDSVVLTALPSVPFCCHEDLLTMSRAQLEGVVRALNTRLPRRLRIGPAEDDLWKEGGGWESSEDDDDDDGLSRMSEVEMKKRVEELVGIRAVVGKNRVPRSGLGLGTTHVGVPPAPKPVRTRDVEWRPYEKTPWEIEMEDQTDGLSVTTEDAFIGSSPLAGRTRSSARSRGRNGALSHLAILQEENEGCESKEDDSEDDEVRPSKRQRLSSESVARHSEEGSQVQIVQEGRESRLIENMDLSGSPLLAREDEASDNLVEFDERATTAAINSDDGINTSRDDVQALPQRRRSARIQEIALRRASSVDTGKKTTWDLKSSILRSKTFSSRCLSGDRSTVMGRRDPERDPGVPRELTIRLPFASTTPSQKPNSSVWSTPRILRSRSQRLLKSGQSTKTKAPLGRSQSEKYPRATDLTFVTVDRPRYRFARHKSRRTEVANGDHELRPSTPTPPAHATYRPRPDQGIQAGTEEYLKGKHDSKDEKENEDPKVDARNPTMGGLHKLPSALCSFLSPRSRAPSTSTVASARGNLGDSPARTVAKEATAPVAVAGSRAGDGVTEHVWEALGRMAVDSV